MLLSLLLEHLRAQHPAFGLRLRSLRDDDGGTLLAFQQRLAQDRGLRLTVKARYRSLVRELLPGFARKSL